jgi:predicted short-subunit dehydrogenase-like oxidoreductase (DUF2520 family)
MAAIKYKAVIIGAGKIAWSVAAALQHAEIEIVAVISKSESSAKTLAAKFKIKNYSASYTSIPLNANLYLLTVPDNSISSVAAKLSKLKMGYHGSVFIHFSGVETSGNLRALSEKGGTAGSIHIMQTFPYREKIISIENCIAAVESLDNSNNKLLLNFARLLKLKPFIINSNAKVVYHITGVLAANFLTGNFFAAEYLLAGKINTRRLLPGIALKAMENAANKGAVNSLSGPVERGDYLTVKKHIDVLVSERKVKKGAGHILLSYISQSLVLLDLVKERAGQLSPGQKKIYKLLKSELQKIKLV